MIEIYSVESRKGGVGKTTIALNLAKALAKKKYDVLLIDCDITGTPITKAAQKSPFWRHQVVSAFKDNPNQGEFPFNMIWYYKNIFLKGKGDDEKSNLKFALERGKVHLIGSDIYYNSGKLIIDPRDLMDDLHSYWFLDMIKDIAEDFCKESKQQRQAIVLDNSPGYVGIGKSIRDWLTSGEVEKVKFVLISSLDEQDIASIISSATDIRMALPNEKVNDFIKVIINKVPEELLEEGSGYDILPDENEQYRELVKLLFPLDSKGYPENIIKYDKAISGQFIEANLLPKAKDKKKGKDLESAIIRLEKKVRMLKGSRKPYTDVTFLAATYHTFLRELNKEGYVRMSQTLSLDDFLPETFIKKMSEQVGQLGSMVHPNPNVLLFSKNDIKVMEVNEMENFLKKNRLEEYYPLFISLLMGLLKKAGVDRKEANIYQLVNLAMMLRAFYAVHDTSFEINSDYRTFLKTIRKKIRKMKLKANKVNLTYPGLQTVEFSAYSQILLNAHFKDFFIAISYTLLRMLDFEKDYIMIINACRDTMEQDAKMMSESLVSYIKKVISKKTEDYDDIRYHQLVTEPFDMKVVQRLIKKYVLS